VVLAFPPAGRRRAGAVPAPRRRSVAVPSFILPLDRQVAQIENEGLMVVEFESLGAGHLPLERRSPKIEVFGSDTSSLVWGFKAVRQG
jgi:hypothetical protein